MYITLDKDREKGWAYRPEKISFDPFDRYDEMYDEFFKIVRGETENPYGYDYEKNLHDILLKACGVQL